jgi:endonuclease YncB( thermonuclease family)
MIRLFLCSVLLVLCGVALAEEFDAEVIAVMDGDTVMVLRDGRKIKIRLANIDAPESDQEFGRESRQVLVNRVLKKQAHIKSQATDHYGRMIAEISVDNHSVNEEQVQNGMAWEYSHFHRNKRYLDLQSEAQQAYRGLWQKKGGQIQPEQWRKTHPSRLQITQLRDANMLCGTKHLCSQMISCEEAKLYFMQCGVKALDGNGDGVPCERLCAVESGHQ